MISRAISIKDVHSEDTGNAQRRWIEQMRILTDAKEVDQGHVPNWLRLKCLNQFGTGPWGSRRGYSVLEEALGKACGTRNPDWMDHWGSTRRDVTISPVKYRRIWSFVVEPYWLLHKDLYQIMQLADALGIVFHISSNSWWFPCHTKRVEFFEDRESFQLGC